MKKLLFYLFLYSSLFGMQSSHLIAIKSVEGYILEIPRKYALLSQSLHQLISRPQDNHPLIMQHTINELQLIKGVLQLCAVKQNDRDTIYAIIRLIFTHGYILAPIHTPLTSQKIPLFHLFFTSFALPEIAIKALARVVASRLFPSLSTEKSPIDLFNCISLEEDNSYRRFIQLLAQQTFLLRGICIHMFPGCSIGELQDHEMIDKAISFKMTGFLKRLTIQSHYVNSLDGINIIPSIKYITELELFATQIRIIPADCFQSFPELSTLIIDSPLITEIHPQAFAQLPKLQKIVLGKHNLTQEIISWLQELYTVVTA